MKSPIKQSSDRAFVCRGVGAPGRWSETAFFGNSNMEDFSKIIPGALAEIGGMDYINLLILMAGFVAAVVIWRLPDIIRAMRDK